MVIQAPESGWGIPLFVTLPQRIGILRFRVQILAKRASIVDVWN